MYGHSARDTQRRKVYRAEERAKMDDGSFDQQLSEVRAFVDRVTRSDWWKGYNPWVCDYEWPGTSVDVLDGRGRRAAGAYTRRRAITLPRYTRKSWIVLHELAHLWVPKECAPHGPEFMRIYADMVLVFLGVEEYCKLSVACTTGGVQSAR